MQARGPLMMEHRLIERMVALMRDALGRIRSDGRTDPLFIDASVDFFRVYADRMHHGKEEDIFFHGLDGKDLSVEHRRLMDELIGEHTAGRIAIQALAAANARYRNGDAAALDDIAEKLGTLVGIYPKHIEKEDKIFFPASRAYLTEEEERAMLAEFREFDRRMIHEKYEALVESLGG